MDLITEQLQIIGVENEIGIDLKKNFQPFFDQAQEWKEKAEGIVVTDADQKELIKSAKEARIALKNIRVEVEHKRKALKEESLRKGKAIDGIANVIKYLITPIENHLKEQEDFVKIQEEKRKAELAASRDAELSKYDVNTQFYQLSEMSEEAYSQLLENSKVAYLTKKEEERKAEEERIAQEKAEAKERERIRLENERLKKEAEEKQKQIEAERKNREEELRLEREKAEAERKIQEEKERKAREAQEAELRREREAKAKIEAELRAKKEAEEKAKREAAAKVEADRKAREKAEKEARLAPDKIKLQKLAEQIVSIQLPDVKNDEAKNVLKQVQVLLNKTSNYIKEKSLEL